jgi:hypothetical protein
MELSKEDHKVIEKKLKEFEPIIEAERERYFYELQLGIMKKVEVTEINQSIEGLELLLSRYLGSKNTDNKKFRELFFFLQENFSGE